MAAAGEQVPFALGEAESTKLVLLAVVVALVALVAMLLRPMSVPAGGGNPACPRPFAHDDAVRRLKAKVGSDYSHKQPLVADMVLHREATALADHVHSGHSARAKTLHFGGAGENATKLQLAQDIGKTLFPDSFDPLVIPCGDTTDVMNLRLRIVERLRRCPGAAQVIILHLIDELAHETLFGLEPFFENEAEINVLTEEELPLTKVVFLLTSSIGAERVTAAREEHGGGIGPRVQAAVNEAAKTAAKQAWRSRPAFAGRLSGSHLPFV